MINDKDKESLLPEIIAVDFDGTLVSDKYPEIGEINIRVWNAVSRAKLRGARLILWTCRTEKYLLDAVQFCADHGLLFDAINDNIAEVKALGWYARKVFATVYVDDKTGFVDGFGDISQFDNKYLFG